MIGIHLANPANATRVSSTSNIDVPQTFRNFCHSYCQGGYDTCDVGSGNLGAVNPGLSRTDKAHHPISAPKNSSEPNCDERYGDTCQQYGSDYGWCNYAQYKCLNHYTEFSNTKYTNVQTTTDPAAEGFVFEHYVDNDTSMPQTTTLSFNEFTMAKASLTLTKTVSIGSSFSFSAGMPGIFESTFTESITVTNSRTDTHEVDKQQGWKVEQVVNVAPKTTIKAVLTIQKTSVTADWSATADFGNGYGKIWCNNNVHGHYEWFIPADEFLPQAYPNDCVGTVCNMRGKLTGWNGASSSVTLHECPLGSRSC